MPPVPERPRADEELAALLAEIPGWNDKILLHMIQRYASSRLFRVRHAANGQLTPRAQKLLEAAQNEAERRGLDPYPQ